MYIGRPSSPAELAEKCSLFSASIVLVKFLCFIPNSPLFLTKNDLVLLSASAFCVVGEFFAVSAPKVQIGVFDAAISFNRLRGGDVVRTYFRKRKNFESEVVPFVKKRAVMSSVEGNEREKERFSSKCKIILGLKAQPLDIPERSALENFSDNAVTPSIPVSNTGLFEYHSKNNDYEEYESKLNTPHEDDSFLVEKRVRFKSVEGNEREKEKSGANNGPILALKALPLDDMPQRVALGNFTDKVVTRSMPFSNTGLLKSQSKNDDCQGYENKLKASQEDDLENYLVMERHQDNATILNTPDVQGEGCRALIFKSLAEISAFLGVDEPDPVDLKANMDVVASSCLNLDQYEMDLSANAAVSFHPRKDFINRQAPETNIEDTVELPLEDCVLPDKRPEKEKNDDCQRYENKLKASQEDDLENYLVMERHRDNATILNTPDVQGEGCRALIFKSLAEISAFIGVDKPDPVDLKANMDVGASSCLNLDQYEMDSSANAAVSFHPCKDFINRQAPETNIEDTVELPLEDCVLPDKRPEKEKNDDCQGFENKLKASQEDDLENYLVMERHQDNATILNTPDVQGEECGALIFKSLAEISAFIGVNEPDPVDLKANMDVCASSCLNLDQHEMDPSANAAVSFHPCKDFINRQAPETNIEDTVELPLEDCVLPDKRPEKEKHSFGSCGLGSLFEDILCTTMESPTSKQPTLPEEIANNEARNQALVPATLQSGSEKTFSRLSAVQKKVPELKPTLKQKASLKSQQGSKVDIFCKKTRGQQDQNTIALKDNGKHIARDIAAVEQKCANKSVKDQQMSNYPEFESYTVEEEEGSGGYGTVYRARRKTDGVTFAIKCPHANAHVHHLKNELKMLQRFGGKNFVIKYEGSLKSGNDDCFVLEHVDHDRPEALKREIDINQLQWYGFCLFKALTSLHKQGVFHRDVKPGNFLFSCKTNNGYLIDFNLAKDLHQKPGSLDKSQPCHMSASEHVPAVQHMFATSSKRRKILSGKPSVALNPGAINGTSRTQESKTLKSKAMGRSKVFDDLGRGNSLASQGADGSGLTSKDLTSTRTSGERRREPIPCQGRKELINLAQKAMQFPNHGTGNAPISKRKRIVASPTVMDQKFIYPTPAPLHSFGSIVLGAGSLNNKGDSKPHKEGPCVGTKGFRAPEVLLRSPYQGPKIDVWSAGVTLLYLITGKMPFTGDPEQNMKDIVKLKGNEELWEAAKLHNRESSMPTELLDVKFLKSMTIKEWCAVNTKRTRFLDAIPISLFDLLEKCLIVNPRLRITAEEALRHDFFAPCHDTLQRMKVRKLSQGRQPSSKSLPELHEPVGTPNSTQLHL
ncbi:uncharacterized protein LOC141612012 [Silene latifolia]|uniref:uncharacterized protein LOC141612012 n=1 Tax=Silene latifolia TaxID=37657 RepID=UPI003D78577B